MSVVQIERDSFRQQQVLTSNEQDFCVCSQNCQTRASKSSTVSQKVCRSKYSSVLIIFLRRAMESVVTHKNKVLFVGMCFLQGWHDRHSMHVSRLHVLEMMIQCIVLLSRFNDSRTGNYLHTRARVKLHLGTFYTCIGVPLYVYCSA